MIKTNEMMATAIISNMEPFDPNDDDWELYTERFVIFTTCNNIVAAKIVSILRDLCTPQKPDALTYTQIKEKLKFYFDSKPHFIPERIKFNNRIQKKGESIQQYVKELKKLFSNCNFGTGLIEHFKDRLVSGIINDKLKRRFRLMKEEDLIYDNMLKEALQDELIDKDIGLWTTIEELNYLKNEKYKAKNNSKTYKGARWNTRKQPNLILNMMKKLDTIAKEDKMEGNTHTVAGIITHFHNAGITEEEEEENKITTEEKIDENPEAKENKKQLMEKKQRFINSTKEIQVSRLLSRPKKSVVRMNL